MILKDLQKLEGAERLAFVKSNKAALIKEKKAGIKLADPIMSRPVIVKDAAMKGANVPNGAYEIIGNSVGFFDSHQDVSLRGSFDKTVQEKGSVLPILINHNHSPESIFAKNLGVSIKEITVKSLGYDKMGTTQCVSAIIEPKYSAKMAELYKGGEIKQHSIGLRYIKLELAINDKDEGESYANWVKYIDQVINREEAEDNGYFFAVKEQQLFEISAVLFGSNPYTPTLSLEQEEPPKALKQLKPSEFDLVKIYQSKIKNNV